MQSPSSVAHQQFPECTSARFGVYAPAGRPRQQSPLEIWRGIILAEGARGLWRGVLAMTYKAVLWNALMMMLKNALEPRRLATPPPTPPQEERAAHPHGRSGPARAGQATQRRPSCAPAAERRQVAHRAASARRLVGARAAPEVRPGGARSAPHRRATYHPEHAKHVFVTWPGNLKPMLDRCACA